MKKWEVMKNVKRIKYLIDIQSLVRLAWRYK
jgi:hypothetical protein